jgi:N-succinyldiaminopimelate aminotransferase
MINPAITQMRPYTADRKRRLFAALAGRVTADLTIGEPQHEPDPRVIEILNQYSASAVSRYPKTKQEPFLTEAIIASNLTTKALSQGTITEGQVLAGLGSGELLYSFASASIDPDKPYVLIPNPAYQVYSSATEVAGGIPYYFNLTASNGFQPDLGAIPVDILKKTSLCYVNTPNNPCAVSYSADVLRELVLLARRYGFAIASDECYSEIYFDTKPVSMLEICADLDGDCSFNNVVAFDTLSKRSSLPGLRSGSMVGDAALIANYLKLRFSERKVMPLNVQRASAFAWTNYEDVARSRELYKAKAAAFNELARAAGLNLSAPSTTFYCWIDIRPWRDDDEEFALDLAEKTGILTFPGSYFSVESGGVNPGAGFIRLALIDTVEATKATLGRMFEFLK